MSDPLIFAIALLVVLASGYAWQRRSRRAIEGLAQEQSHLARERDAQARRAAQAEAQLEALGLAVLEAIVCVDPHSRVTYATPGARSLFEAGGEAVGRSLIEFTRSAELDQLAADALAYAGVAGGPRDELDRVIPIANRPFRVRAAAFDGGAVLALSDVSELQRLGRARRDFVANISHELRTPLTSIRLLLEDLLAGAPRDPGESVPLLRKIQVEVEALQQMAQELLDLSQIESGRMPLRLVPASIEQLAAETIERFAAQAERKRQTIEVDVAASLSVLADVELVGRALGNLLHNAIKFTPDEGRVRLRAYPQAGDAVIEVSDTGPGVPPEDLPRVFERFFRGDRARAGCGTGLGLAIAKHVVEAHGGRIWAENAPGQGAIFRFTLPVA